MPSFPGAVKTFTTKVDGAGNTIFAAHVNDLQDEVTAIEQGLVQGSAPIVSSRISAPALSISASSTLAALVIPSTGRVACRVAHSTLTPVGASATAGVSWDTEIFDNAAQHSTALNSSQIVLPRLGSWHVGAWIVWNPSSAGSYRDVRIYKNDSELVAMHRSPVQGLGSNDLHQVVETVIQASSITDYITIVAANDAGSTQSLSSLGRAWAAITGA